MSPDDNPADVTEPIVVSLDGFYSDAPRGVRSKLLRLPTGELVLIRDEADAIAGTIAAPTPRERLRDNLAENSRAIAEWPAFLRAAINTSAIFPRHK